MILTVLTGMYEVVHKLLNGRGNLLDVSDFAPLCVLDKGSTDCIIYVDIISNRYIPSGYRSLIETNVCRYAAGS